jgi:hypothetical protein
VDALSPLDLSLGFWARHSGTATCQRVRFKRDDGLQTLKRKWRSAIKSSLTQKINRNGHDAIPMYVILRSHLDAFQSLVGEQHVCFVLRP